MTEKFKKHTIFLKSGVARLDFKRVFISDDLVSAGIGHHGLTQISYHGKQPVSRNAYMVRSHEKEAFTLYVNHRKVMLKNLFLSSYGFLCENNRQLPLISCFASHKSIILTTGNRRNELSVEFDEASLFTNVHGTRKWEKRYDKEQLVYVAHDCCEMKKWVNENGCFLVNMKEHSRLFDVKEGVDANNSDEPLHINENHIGSKEMIFDSYVYMTVHRIDKATTCVSFGDDMNDLKKERKRIVRAYRNIINRQIGRYEKLNRKLPVLSFDKYSSLNEMVRMIPFYAESVKLKNRDIIRASASDYYWVWGWDSLVSLNEFSKWNDIPYQQKAIAFYQRNSLEDGSIPHRWNRDFSILQSGKFGYTECLFVMLVFDVYLKTKNKKILMKYYPDIMKIFAGLSEKRNSSGFIQGLGVYPDSPHKLGRNSKSMVAMDNSAFYLLCNIMQEISLIAGDRKTLQEVTEIIDFFDIEFLSLFYDDDTKSIIDHVDEDGKFNVRTFPSYSYIANYNRYGYLLYHKKMKEISRFFADEYLVSNGVRNLPENDVNVFSEPIHNSWYPHWDIYVIKYMRLSEQRNKLEGYLNSLSSMWERTACVMELLDLKKVPEGDERLWQGHGQPWNLNCATAVYKTIFDSVIGVVAEHDYLTVAGNGIGYEMNVSNLRMGRKRITANISKGMAVIPKIWVNEKEMKGTLKLPSVLFKKRNNILKVDYENEQEDYPVIVESWMTEIQEVSVRENKLTVKVNTDGKGRLLIHLNKKPEVSFNDKETKVINYENDRYLIFFEGEGEMKIWKEQR